MVLSQGYVNFHAHCHVISRPETSRSGLSELRQYIEQEILLEQEKNKVTSLLEVLVRHTYSRE